MTIEQAKKDQVFNELVQTLKQMKAHADAAYVSDGEIFLDESYVRDSCENALNMVEELK